MVKVDDEGKEEVRILRLLYSIYYVRIYVCTYYREYNTSPSHSSIPQGLDWKNQYCNLQKKTLGSEEEHVVVFVRNQQNFHLK